MRYNLISRRAEQRAGCVLLCHSGNDQLWGKKKKSVGFKKVRMKKYQVEEFSYFFLRLKDLKAFYLSSESGVILSQMRQANI